MPERLFLRRLSYGQKLFLLATLPLILAVSAIALMVAAQSRALAEHEIATLEQRLLDAKKQELRNYVTQARNGFYATYNSAPYDSSEAQLKVLQILAAMTYGDEGFFFVYTFDGTNLVSPRQTDMINQNVWDLTDSEGTPVVQQFIETARAGGGWVEHLWPKPSTGEEERMLTYATSLPQWQWVIGTGVFIDDVLDTVSTSQAEMRQRVRRTFVYIGAITLIALMSVFASGMVINIRERRLADAKLKRLTQRVFDAQEEERGRVARELHDGISQLLVGVRYALDAARRRMAAGDPRAAETLDRGMASLGDAIQEVRRISRDLRPGALDDLGLGPAIKTLVEDFGARTGIETAFSTVVFRNRLDKGSKIALYRIAQEALTNIERHSGATRIEVEVRGHSSGARLRIADNGHGLPPGLRDAATGGLGLRNMQERVERLDGTLVIRSTASGTEILAQVPLSHLLEPGRGEASEVPDSGPDKSPDKSPDTETTRD